MASVERLPRESSIDLVRGADVLLMLFVNEMAGVRGTPAFLLHRPHDVDGMTITDVVFPRSSSSPGSRYRSLSAGAYGAATPAACGVTSSPAPSPCS